MSKEQSALEVYVRFNDDLEKDYCFQVATSSRFRDLLRIFETLPISLRPNLFYSSKPKAFQVSTSPGYLTEDGALLFSYETDQKKFQKNVAMDDLVARHCWPGQLIMPVWEFNYFRFYSFVTFLFVWLYTDLPDFVSPTPGICLTNQASNFIAFIATKFGYGHIADAVIKDVQEPVSIGGQCVFFAFHVLKIIVVFFVVHVGLFNPRKFRYSKDVEITKEKLLELGWTGSRRATPDEYAEAYREYKIKEHGGMVPAHQAGLFNKLKKLGVWLGEGEGFDTPLSKDNKISDITSDKWVLSYELFVKLGEVFEKHIEGKGTEELNACIKQFRRFGLMHSDEDIQKLVDLRKEGGDKKIEKGTKKADEAKKLQ
ncbi:glucose repression protein [Candidozyma auris]|uniref:Glucose-signaling factor 2 n=2 Tax=Candidozyma auris TaxID=498019 RepID=A0A2H1A7T2_CANAR|nr:hypothetical_protein [[Candida] auris]KNE00338.2 hypothetical protein QG37_02362 [[Candida] auris]PIS57349.1 hypothetical protein CJI97_000383 [[Candida] auris]PIS58926.1 hypothetical protein B9J08_000383 [[Candida] auris]QEO20301.1 hypothetical_protein [[Candida] auris]QWW23215.1 hypothetical protein CA7LBN_002016 [[Candida] auris]